MTDADASVALAHAFQGTGLTVDAVVKTGRFYQTCVTPAVEHDGGDVASHRCYRVVFVNDYQTMRPPYGLENRLLVERSDRAQVDDLGGDPALGEGVGGGQGLAIVLESV